MSAPLPLVLLPFFGSSHREWAAVIARFGATRPIVTTDMPGFGDLAGTGPKSVAEMADHIASTVEAAGLSACIVVGHSMSSKMATVLAARRPSWLRGLVLVTGSPPSPEPFTDEARAKLLAYDGSVEAAGDYLDGITATRLPDDLRRIAIADAQRASLAAWKAWIASGSQEDWSDRVGVLTVPTLIVAAASDPSLGETVQRERVLPHFAHAELVVIDGGHALPYENPHDLHREIARFAAQRDAD